MFKQIKSAIFWTLLYKFRRRVMLIVMLLSVVLLSQWIYSDIVEYLTLNKKIEYLTYILPLKWLTIFTCITVSAFLILTIFKTDTKTQSKELKEKPEKKEAKESKKENKNNDTLSSREKYFMQKKTRTQEEIIFDKQK